MITLREAMEREDGWGRGEGREVFQRLVELVERQPDQSIHRISLKGVTRFDVSFASETLVELARRYRAVKGFCLTDIANEDIEENLDAAAKRKEQPLMVMDGDTPRFVGMQPSQGTKDALSFVVARPQARAAEFVAAHPTISIANASTKLKQLWTGGFLMRHESAADTGGVEFVYYRIA